MVLKIGKWYSNKLGWVVRVDARSYQGFMCTHVSKRGRTYTMRVCDNGELEWHSNGYLNGKGRKMARLSKALDDNSEQCAWAGAIIALRGGLHD